MSPLASFKDSETFISCEDGGYVLLTVEEYRERISDAWLDGKVGPDQWYHQSATKRRLDEEVGRE
jgi:hypothetical protein